MPDFYNKFFSVYFHLPHQKTESTLNNLNVLLV